MTIASWLVQRVAEEEAQREAATAAQVAELLAEVRSLRATLIPEQSMADPGWRRPPSPAAASDRCGDRYLGRLADERAGLPLRCRSAAIAPFSSVATSPWRNA